MAPIPDRFSSVEDMLSAWQPSEPVYCIYPHVYLEFGHIGAYSLSGRTRFNGHYSEQLVEITSRQQLPPA